VKKVVTSLVIGLLFYVAFLVVQFPSRQAYALLESHLEGVQLYEPEGTVWQGKAKALDFRNQRFQAIEWQLKPWSVVLGRLDIDWSFDNGDAFGNGTAGLGWDSSVKLSAVSANLPSTFIQPYLPDMPAKLGGIFSVDLDELYYDSAESALRTIAGELVWRSAAVTVVSELPLGEFQVVLITDESGIVGQLKEADTSDLLAAGQLSLSADNSYKVDVTLAVRNPPQRRDLSQGLSFIGRPDAKGQFKLSYSGQL